MDNKTGNQHDPARQEMARMVQKTDNIVNLGCRLNISEGNHIAALMAQNPEKYRDVMVVNSCAVTKHAERKSLQAARKLKRDNPNKKLIFTGCAAQIAPEKYQKIAEIDAVIGNDKKLQLDSVNLDEPPIISDIFNVTETALHLVESFRFNHSRAFMQIQNGCDHRCTFCIIPYGRGNSRSLAPSAIIDQIKELTGKELTSRHIQEIVLTGVDLTSYDYHENNRDWSLGILVQEILNQVPNLPRLRISSLDCIEIDDALKAAFQSERLMPHLHLSLQSGDNLILKRMKRRHNRDQAIELCQILREIRPDIVFGADIIAGFPTETDAHFAQSCAMIEDCGLTWLHVFPFSAREGTPAARMKPLHGDVVRKRAHILREMGKKATQQYLHSCIGQTLPILLERPLEQNGKQGLSYAGYSPHFAETIVELKQSETATSLRGNIVMAEIQTTDGQKLHAR